MLNTVYIEGNMHLVFFLNTHKGNANDVSPYDTIDNLVS